MPREIYRVFVSSTWEDLRPEREAVDAALREMFETKYWGIGILWKPRWDATRGVAQRGGPK